jgi:hypothetical protein
MTPDEQKIKDHKIGLQLAEALGLKKSGNLYMTSWGLKTPIGLVRSIRLIVNQK